MYNVFFTNVSEETTHFFCLKIQFKAKSNIIVKKTPIFKFKNRFDGLNVCDRD